MSERDVRVRELHSSSLKGDRVRPAVQHRERNRSLICLFIIQTATIAKPQLIPLAFASYQRVTLLRGRSCPTFLEHEPKDEALSLSVSIPRVVSTQTSTVRHDAQLQLPKRISHLTRTCERRASGIKCGTQLAP